MGTKYLPPKLTVKGDDEPISLHALSMDVRVAGSLAELSWEMTFKNPHPRVLEAELQFPLPDEAAVSGYAVEMNGALVDAVPVEKETARVAFETAVREGKDAGLVEQAKGNVFTTRIARIEANAFKRVKVTYELQLSSPSLIIPLCSTAPLADLSLHVQVLGSSAPLISDCDDKLKAGLEFKGQELSANFKDIIISKPVVIGIPSLDSAFMKKPEPEILVATDPATPTDGFFILNQFVEVPERQTTTSTQTASSAPLTRIALFYDASLSRSKHDRVSETNIIKRILESLSKQQGIETVDVIIFRNALETPKTCNITTQAGIDEAVGHCEGSLFDGGTQLSLIESITKLNSEHPYKLALLFTDGLVTLGNEVPKDMAFGCCPIHVFCADIQSNPGLLSFIAQKSNGVFHNVSSPSFSIDGAIAALGRPVQFAYLTAVCTDNSVSEIYPAHPVPIPESSRFTISGRLANPTKGGSLLLRFGFGAAEVIHEFKINVPPSDRQSSVVSRFWARAKVSELTVFGDKHKEEIASLGRRYGFVTPGTSLLVLESLDQYERYGIVPSQRGLPHVFDEFMSRKKQKEQQESNRISSKLSNYALKWKERVKWWETKRPSMAEKLVGDLKSTRAGARSSKITSEHNRMDQEHNQKLEQFNAEESNLRQQLEDLKPKPQIVAKDKKEKEEEEEEEAPATACDEDAEEEKPVMAKCKSKKKSAAAPARRMMMRREEEECERSIAPSMKCAEMAAPEMDLCCQSATMAPPMPGSACPPPPPSLSSSSAGGPPPPPPPAPCRAAAPPQQQPSQSQPEPEPSNSASIKLKSWDPDTPYIRTIKESFKSGIEAAYNTYIQERETNGSSPAFYLDVAECFYRTFKDKALALRILTSIVELGIEEPQLYRIVGYKLDEMGELELSISVFEKVLHVRANEPQSHRDLALVQTKVGKYKDALNGLWKVVTGEWDSRFDEIELTALTEINRLLWLAKTKGVTLDLPKDLDKRFISPVDVDLRFSMAWDTDMTDVDLHTIEPTGDECYYGNKNTPIGGLNSRDFTRGYGPEEYMLKRAAPGMYKIRAKYYSNSQQSLSGGTTILLTIFTNYSRPNEDMQLITIRLAQSQDIIDVGEIEFKREMTKDEAKAVEDTKKSEDEKDEKADRELEQYKKNIAVQLSKEEEKHNQVMKSLQEQIEKLKANPNPNPNANATEPTKPTPTATTTTATTTEQKKKDGVCNHQ